MINVQPLYRRDNLLQREARVRLPYLLDSTVDAMVDEDVLHRVEDQTWNLLTDEGTTWFRNVQLVVEIEVEEIVDTR